ncbi:MAG TPA: acyltransferase [Chitinophagales bacterium]|jgi:peptidoglycan/LPS O-acetylase OafA/YrhL|nr:acyltransferase [Chitinophagales bacterium]MBP6154452.1 acyltransferase [Chitinophagales bacterium]HQV77649.1 acyltransferase [Chitinophagales bacterium]HQW78122.1 acyltransferase [Chitinophagales bacterium]
MTDKPKIDASNPMYYLAGWRGVAALLIFIIHFRLRKYNLPSVLGYTGTHSFFLISAYFVSLGLFKKFENTQINIWKTFKDFVLKRILKIMPVYFLYIFLMLFISIVLMLIFKVDIEKVDAIRELKQFGIGLFTYTYNFREVYNVFVLHHYVPESPMTYPHLWYISFDLQMCIIIFLFIAFFRNRDLLLKISIFGVIAMVTFRFIAWELLAQIPSDPISREYIFEKIPFMQLDTIFYGFILCLYDFKKSKKLFWALLFAAILCYGWAFYRAYLISVDTGLPLRTTLREDIHVIPYYGIQVIDSTVAFFIFILFACIINFPEKFKLLLNPILVNIGGLSLSMYIFQFLFILIGMFIVGGILRKFLPGVLADVIGLISFLVLDYFFAGIIYKKFEKPIHKIIDTKIFKKGKE